MNKIKPSPQEQNPSGVLSRKTLDLIQTRLQGVQAMKLPESAINELHDNIRNPETIMVLLGEQIITTHNLIMLLALRASSELKHNFSNRLPATNATAKLIHAFAGQIELLEHLKEPDSKKINIANMNISDNGQAFVGSYSKSCKRPLNPTFP